MYRPPGMPRWQHRLLIDIACFDGEPSAQEIAAAAGQKLSSSVTHLRAMNRVGLVAVARHEDEVGRMPNTYSLTEAGECLFEEIINADAALKRLGRQRRRARL